MTSKEAILELICEAKSVNIDERRVYFLRKIIEKDLEVLEILKKYSYSHDDNTLFIALDCMEFDKLKKIKEWLKNE